MGAPVHVVYTPEYDISFFGVEKLHPFDTHKYSRAWNAAREQEKALLEAATIAPDRPVSDEELLRVHTPAYLAELRSPAYLAQALEVPPVALFPYALIDSHVLRPMRLATRGTILAAEKALETGGVAVNLSGGYHHASREKGEGFCVFSDVPVAISAIRADGRLTPDARILIIDLDAHQGNGFERACREDDPVSFLDLFNEQIYPRDGIARERINVPLPVKSGIGDEEYLGLLRGALPDFLDKRLDATLAFYNAGTDVHQSDLLGGMNLTDDGVFERDRFVLDALAERGIPTVMTLSGGYSPASYALVARTLLHLLRRQ